MVWSYRKYFAKRKKRNCQLSSEHQRQNHFQSYMLLIGPHPDHRAAGMIHSWVSLGYFLKIFFKLSMDLLFHLFIYMQCLGSNPGPHMCRQVLYYWATSPVFFGFLSRHFILFSIPLSLGETAYEHKTPLPTQRLLCPRLEVDWLTGLQVLPVRHGLPPRSSRGAQPLSRGHHGNLVTAIASTL